MGIKMRHVGIMTVMFAWQNAPITVVEDESTGRTHIAFGAGAYGLSAASVVGYSDCSGPAVYRDENVMEGVGSIGGMVDVDAGHAVRVSVSGGYFHSGPFGGFLVAWEGRRAGVGAGFSSGHSDFERQRDSTFERVRIGYTSPAAYLRLGARTGTHLRADLVMPATTFGLTGRARLGVGVGAGREDLPQVFIGVAAVQAWAPKGTTLAREVFGGFIDMNIALWERGDLQLRGHATEHGVGIGAGIRSAW